MNDASARAAAASTGMNQSKCNADSMSNAARSKGVFVYDPPEQCQMMVICAGSPRAASTAHCMIAEHVIHYIMESRKKIGRSKYDAPDYAGYWNYHLHAVCSDGQPCPLYDAVTGDLAEFKQHVSSLPNLDGEEKDALRHACDKDVTESTKKLAEVDQKTVVIVKSHEFDKTLLSACSKRLILTSWRAKEDVFDSGLELGWFAYPKEAARDDFNEVYEVWDGWHTCWRDAAVAESQTTRNHDLGFEALNKKDSFKAEVRRLAKMAIHLMNVPEKDIDLDALVADVVAEDFHEELNPMLSNGNQSPAAATGEAEEPIEPVNWRRIGLHVDSERV